MLLKWTGALLLLLVFVAADAQENKATKGNRKVSFSSIQQVGLIMGADVPELQLQVVNGVRYKSFFGCLGAGLDYYYLRSVPLFVDVRKTLSKKRNPLYAYGAVGVNIPWPREREKNPWIQSDYKTGLYADAGAGYLFPLGKTTALFFNAGYSLKTFSEARNSGIFCIDGPCPDRKEKLVYDLRRISLKAGFRF